MAIVMMNSIQEIANMMVETAADKMLTLKYAQNVNANSRSHVLLEFIAHWWVTVFAMMN